MANSYLSKTFSSAGNRNKWTVSVWLKRSKLGAESPIFTCVPNGNFETFCGFGSNDTITFKQKNDGSTSGQYVTNRKFRDTNGFYHLVFVYDKDNSTAGDRGIIYVNGVRETSFSTSSNFSDSSTWNSTSENWIGKAGSSYFDGYMSHFSFVDGQALAPTVFGETDSTSGIWKFKSPSGVTWGTNGFHLKMENSAALGTDSSGNTNTFTVNGNLKQALDTPSNVYATYNSLNPNNPDFSNGNNTLTRSSNSWKPAWTTIGASSGKYYCEMDWDSGSNFTVGFSTADVPGSNPALDDIVGNPSNGGYLTVLYDNGVIYNNGSSAGAYGSGSSYTTGDIMMLAMDLDNNKFYFGKNGTWFNSANPANNTGGYDINASYTNSTWCFTACVYGTGSWHGNFGNGFFGTTAITSAGSNGNGSLFEYDVPSGYYALNTKNINTYG